MAADVELCGEGERAAPDAIELTNPVRDDSEAGLLERWSFVRDVILARRKGRLRGGALRRMRRKVVRQLTRRGRVSSVAWSHDDKFLAVGSYDKTAAIVDVASGEVVNEFPRGGSVSSVAWSHDDKFLAVGSSDNTAAIVEVASGEVVREVPRGGSVSSVDWSHDDKFLAVGSSDKTAAIVEVASGKVVREVPRGRRVTSVAWSHDDNCFAVGSFDKTALIIAGPLQRSAAAKSRSILSRADSCNCRKAIPSPRLKAASRFRVLKGCASSMASAVGRYRVTRLSA